MEQARAKNESLPREPSLFTLKLKRYTLLASIPISFHAAPICVILNGIFFLISSSQPIIFVYSTAALIETSAALVDGVGGADALILPIVLILSIVVFGKIQNAVEQISNTHQRLSLYTAFRSAIIEKRARLKYAYVENNNIYDLIRRVSANPAERICDTLHSLIQLTSMTVQVISLLVVLIANVGWMALIVIAAGIPAQYIAMKNGQRIYVGFKESEKVGRRAGYLSDILIRREAVDERTMFGFSERMNTYFAGFSKQFYEILEKTHRLTILRKTFSDILILSVSLGVAVVLAISAINGATSVAMFVALTGMVFTLMQYTSNRIPRLVSGLTDSAAYFRDLTEFAALETVEGAEVLPRYPVLPPDKITFRNVVFAYPGIDAVVLKGVNFTFEKNKHYAIVGANGAGKSTIIKLLIGLYQEYIGEILINERELRDIPSDELKATFAVAYQDFARYGITLEENIALGGNIEKAVTIMNIDEIAAELPKGMDSIISKEMPDGQDLSGGQWQRVALARVLANPAPVIILDEPTAALDPISESNAYQHFKEISRGRTTIFISHRLGSVKLADEIIVLEGGIVAEQGTHKQLIAQCGIYAEMYEAQRSWYQ